MKKTAYFLFAIAICFVTSFSASAQTIIHTEDFTVNQTPLFDFGAFSGNTSFVPMGLQVAVPDAADLMPPAASNFGGIGIAPQVPVNLDGVTTIEVKAQLDAGNASDLVLSIREGIAGAAGDGEFFSITIPQSSFTTGSFSTVSIDLATNPGFNGDFPANPGSNGVLDGVLGNTGIQNPFGGTATSNFTIQSVTFINNAVVPEPSSLALLLSLGSIVGIRRRRS